MREILLTPLKTALIAPVLAFALLFLVNAGGAFAQEFIEYKTTSITDIGYTKGVTLRGINPSHNFYFPVSGTKIIPRENLLKLDIEFSPVLPKESLLKVDVNDNTAYTFPLKGEKPRLNFRIPIDGASIDPKDKFVKITVSAYQFVKKDFGYDVSALWIDILPSSFLQLAFNDDLGQSLNISKFFSYLQNEKRVTIAIPKIPSAEEAQSAVWVYSFLKRELGEDAVINVMEFISREFQSWIPYVLEDNLIVIGKRIRDGEGFEVPNLKLVRREQLLSDGEKEIKSVLLITGENDDQVQKSARGFLEEGIRRSSFGDTLFIKKRIELYEGKNGIYEGKQKFSLQELGFTHFQVEGMGEKRVDVFFSLGMYPRLPENLSFVIFGEHTPVDRRQGMGFLNIYLNGSLVESFELEDGKIDGFSVPLPHYILGRENTLGIEFSYLPLHTNNGNALSEFKGIIYDTSYLEAKGGETAEALFEHLPWFLLYPAFQVYFKSPPDFQDVKIAGELLYLLWQTHGGRETYPQAAIGGLPPKGNLMAVLSPSDLDALGLLPPLLPIGALRIIDYRTQKIIWGVEDGMPLGIIEVFKDRERNILLGTYMGEDGKGRLIDFLDSLGGENNFLRLTGNITLGNGRGSVYAFQEKELKVEYPEPEFLSAFWKKYRLVAFVAAWLLLVSFTIYIYFNSQRRLKG